MLHDTDEYLLSMTGQSLGQQTTALPGNRTAYRNFRENVINQLKHRILVFLYRRAVALTEGDGNLFELRKFYQFFDQVFALFLFLFGDFMSSKGISYKLKVRYEELIVWRIDEC